MLHWLAPSVAVLALGWSARALGRGGRERGQAVSAIELILSMAAGVFRAAPDWPGTAGRTMPPSLEQAARLRAGRHLDGAGRVEPGRRLDEGPSRLGSAVVAGLAAKRFGRAWVCILVGMGMYWLLRLVRG